ncbi:nuclear transport factor 2 family protein [Saprospira grandis]|nr:nuclear transport factor 2 family protein [Saprospira grandis]
MNRRIPLLVSCVVLFGLLLLSSCGSSKQVSLPLKEENMENKALIDKFYMAFAAADYETMVSCYHPEVVFEDPAFGRLQGERAKKMWEMLLTQSKDSILIRHSELSADAEKGQAKWVADYKYGDKRRPVHNIVRAQFRFKDGLIIEHRDQFNLWRWSKQALGTTGHLLGWSGFFRKKMRQTTNGMLDKYMAKQEK